MVAQTLKQSDTISVKVGTHSIEVGQLFNVIEGRQAGLALSVRQQASLAQFLRDSVLQTWVGCDVEPVY